jgi:hypothetical protein
VKQPVTDRSAGGTSFDAALGGVRHAATESRDAVASPSVMQTLGQSGRPLEPDVQARFESRLGQDLSHVRVHTDALAARSARDMGALAYTAGRDVVFGHGQYAPQSAEGQRLMAHELTHVAQQAHARPSGELRINTEGETQAERAEMASAAPLAPVSVNGGLQRKPDPKVLSEFDTRIAALRTTKVFTGLASKARTEFDEIVAIARARNNPLYYAEKLELLFSTKEKTSATKVADTSKTIKDAADAERARLKKQSKAAKDTEEGATADKKRTFTTATGMGGKTFQIDASDPTNIAVFAKVRLMRTGAGTDADVANVKVLEDVIEKRASTLGYTVDLDFVDKAGTDVFDVKLDTSDWTFADNWADGPVGLVHELHHVLGLSEDRYDYIESHSGNEEMKIPDRIHWFREEFRKSITNNTESMMNTGEKLPLDEDVCMVAGKRTKVDIDDCIKKREAARAAKLNPGLNKASARAQKAAGVADAKSNPLAATIFSTVPGPTTRKSKIGLLPGLLTFGNLQLTSSITATCAAGPAFVQQGPSPIALCPDFMKLSVVEQSRVLLVQALQLPSVGIAGAKDCPTAGCAATCGDQDNASAWARYIECCEKL